MLKYVFTTILLCIVQTVFISAQPSQALGDLVAQIVAPYLEEDNVFQLQVGIVERDYNYHYTFVGNTKTDTVKTDSTALFCMGSITKTFTTALLVAMVEDNLLQLQDPITNYLPDSVVIANNRLQKITIEQLATHTSGFPKTPRNLPLKMKRKENPYANYKLKDVYEYLMTYQPSMNKKRIKALKKGENLFVYSHFGMGLLGHLLETAGGKPYDDLLQYYIFEPLKLKDTGLLESVESKETLLEGHDFVGNIKVQQDYASLYASEGLYTSLRDLLQFIKANMKPIAPYGFLSSLLERKSRTDKKKIDVGLGWFIIDRGNSKKYPPIYTHSGKIGGFSTYVSFIEKTQTAVLVLSNSSRRVDDIGITILELINR